MGEVMLKYMDQLRAKEIGLEKKLERERKRTQRLAIISILTNSPFPAARLSISASSPALDFYSLGSFTGIMHSELL